MIAVTCRNGEHFSVDPDAIERVETDPDTVIHLVDGTKYVVAETFDQLLRTIQVAPGRRRRRPPAPHRSPAAGAAVPSAWSAGSSAATGPHPASPPPSSPRATTRSDPWSRRRSSGWP